MSTGDTQGNPGGPAPTEEELRAAYEAEIKKIRVEQIVLENVVTLINLGMRRTGLSPGTEDERDLEQVHMAIESIRTQIPLLEQSSPDQVGPIRDALSQLQMAFVRLGGTRASGGGGSEAGPSGGPGDAGGTAGPGSGGPGTGGPGPGGPGPGGPGGPESPAEPPPAKPGEPGPAQRSGRLWVPGQ